ncbi:hypothetical protein RG903_06335 [Thermithiobacillus tepidarius DSM 3134]|uniref:hypothetical protein n=1 Tax=Thermithiobacillus tepidarius TaxID=929 RepID=UPI00048C48A4|nr:hypothetical protein [Thermithiobacillus tepidarius]
MANELKTDTKMLLTGLVLAGLSAGCATNAPGVYRGGVLMQPGPLGIQEHYSFRFVDKWRISHNWLSGPVELRGC